MARPARGLAHRHNPAQGSQGSDQERAVYTERLKPFNFVLAARVARFGRPPQVDPNRFQLIAPYTRDSRQWRKLN